MIIIDRRISGAWDLRGGTFIISGNVFILCMDFHAFLVFRAWLGLGHSAWDLWVYEFMHLPLCSSIVYFYSYISLYT